MSTNVFEEDTCKDAVAQSDNEKDEHIEIVTDSHTERRYARKKTENREILTTL